MCVFVCVCVCVCVCVRERRKIERTEWGKKVPVPLDGIRTCTSGIRAHRASDYTTIAGTPRVSQNKHFRQSPASSIVKQSCKETLQLLSAGPRRQASARTFAESDEACQRKTKDVRVCVCVPQWQESARWMEARQVCVDVLIFPVVQRHTLAMIHEETCAHTHARARTHDFFLIGFVTTTHRRLCSLLVCYRLWIYFPQ